MKQRRRPILRKTEKSFRRGNLAGSVTWLKDGQFLMETPASWLSEDGGNAFVEVKNNDELSLLGAGRYFALVDRLHRDPRDQVGSLVAVLTAEGIELRRLFKVASTYFTVIPSGADPREVRTFGEFSIFGKVQKVVVDLLGDVSSERVR